MHNYQAEIVLCADMTSRVLMGPEICIKKNVKYLLYLDYTKNYANFDGLRFYPRSPGGAPALPGMARGCKCPDATPVSAPAEG